MKKQNLNIGDSLLCKKNLSLELHNFFNKNKYYIVCFVNIFGDDYSYDILDEDNIVFTFLPKHIRTYFYTKREVRNIKLKKINEETES